MSAPRMSVQPPGTHFSCRVRSHARGALWARAEGELDLVSAAWCEQTVNAALRVAALVVFDLRQLTFVDSAGAHAIERIAARARRNRRRLLVVQGAARIERVLLLTGVIERLDIVELKPVLLSSPEKVATVPVA